MGSSPRIAVFCAASIGAWICAGLVFAPSVLADRIVRGTVVAREAGELYFDLGADSGIQRGGSVRLRRPITLRHPISRKPIADELPLGHTTLTRVGDNLSLAVAEAALYQAVKIGDIVEVLVVDEQAPAPAPAAAVELPATDPATQQVLQTWHATAGSDLETRIAAWEHFASAHPDSPYLEAIRTDLEVLYHLRRRLPQPMVDSQRAIPGIEHNARRTADVGDGVALAFALRNPDDVIAAWLHYRPVGQATYHRAALEPDGDGYLRGTLPGHAVHGPGIEYFAEVATADGDVGTAAGSPGQPIVVDVEDDAQAQVFGDRSNRSQVSLTTTYLDFATFDDRDGNHEDRFVMFEADFLYRIQARMLHGIRMGMGTIGGRGGYADRTEPEEAGFHYGYTEVELRSRPTRAYLVRLIAGLGREGLGFGLEGRLRLGPEEGSNLTFAASSLEEIGFLSEVRMQWGAIRRVPLGFAVAVTDRPNRGDVGVRLTTDVGWRVRPWLRPILRLSYQGRSVEHAGVGAGAGLVLDW